MTKKKICFLFFWIFFLSLGNPCIKGDLLQEKIISKELNIIKENIKNADNQVKIIEKKIKNFKHSKEEGPQPIKKTLEYSLQALVEYIFSRLEVFFQGLQELFHKGLPIPLYFPYGPFFFLPLFICGGFSLLSLILGRYILFHRQKKWEHQESLFPLMSRRSLLSSFSWISFFWPHAQKEKKNRLWAFFQTLDILLFPGRKKHHHDENNEKIDNDFYQNQHYKKNEVFQNHSIQQGQPKIFHNTKSLETFNENSPNEENSLQNIGQDKQFFQNEQEKTHYPVGQKNYQEETKTIRPHRIIFKQIFFLPLGPLVPHWLENRLVIMSALFFTPSLIYFVLSLILGRILVVMDLVDKSFLSLGYGALFPLYIYIFWATWQWLNLIVFEKLLLIEEYHSDVLLYGRLAVVFGFFGAIFLTFLDILNTQNPIQGKGFKALQDFFILFFLWLLYKMFKSIPKESPLCQGKKNTLRSIFHWLSFVCFGLMVAWFLFPKKIFSSLIPLYLTSFVFLMFVPLERWIHYYQLFFRRYLSHKSFFKKNAFLTHKKIPLRITQIFSILSLGSLWSLYLFWTNHEPMYNFFLSTGIMMMASPFFQKFSHTAVIVLVALFFVKGADRVLKYYVEDRHVADSHENNFFAVRLRTLMSMLKTLVRVLIWMPAITLIFSQFENINLATFVTGITAASVGLTFGIQNIVRDFITGFFIILENNLMVGDEVEIDQRVGKVEAITLRTLKIRADNGTLLTIPFGSITIIGNRNRVFSAVLLNISVGYSEDLDKVQQLIERAFLLTKRLPVVGRKITGSLELRGINEVTSFSVVFQGKIMTAPNAQDMVRRAFNRQLKKLFDENNIVVPTAPFNPSRGLPSLTQTQI